MTHHIEVPRSETGQRLTYAERRHLRRQAERQQREHQREQQQQDVPTDPPISWAEMQAIRRGTELGKQLAAEHASSLAPVVTTNPFRVRAAQLEGQPHVRHRYRAMLAKADAWDREQIVQKAEAERQHKIENDVGVKNARENAGYLLKSIPDDPELKEEAAICLGLAQAGSVQLYWDRVRDLEQRVWQRQEKLAAEARASASAVQAGQLEQARLAQDARERFDHAEKMASQAVRN